MNTKAAARWSIVIAVFATVTILVWEAIYGPIPSIQHLGWINGLPIVLPLAVSAWWNVLAGPMFVWITNLISYGFRQLNAAMPKDGSITASQFAAFAVAMCMTAITAFVTFAGMWIAPIISACSVLIMALLSAILTVITYYGGWYLVELPIRKAITVIAPLSDRGLRWLCADQTPKREDYRLIQ